MSQPDVTIFHNPDCGTSRKTLALLQERGIEPRVVEYLKVGWSADQLRGLLARMGASAHDILRVRDTNAEDLGLTDPATPQETLIEAMVRDPMLVNRPIVVTPKGAALCRPQETVLELI
ncbi:MAG TPA: arsenate reductase (glutaredoxin) [Caulobacter sp.]|nr:arsenate reductase (glutaredoxin) [Caulobacter sp.]